MAALSGWCSTLGYLLCLVHGALGWGTGAGLVGAGVRQAVLPLVGKDVGSGCGSLRPRRMAAGKSGPGVQGCCPGRVPAPQPGPFRLQSGTGSQLRGGRGERDLPALQKDVQRKGWLCLVGRGLGLPPPGRAWEVRPRHPTPDWDAG